MAPSRQLRPDSVVTPSPLLSPMPHIQTPSSGLYSAPARLHHLCWDQCGRWHDRLPPFPTRVPVSCLSPLHPVATVTLQKCNSECTTPCPPAARQPQSSHRLPSLRRPDFTPPPPCCSVDIPDWGRPCPPTRCLCRSGLPSWGGPGTRRALLGGPGTQSALPGNPQCTSPHVLQGFTQRAPLNVPF